MSAFWDRSSRTCNQPASLPRILLATDFGHFSDCQCKLIVVKKRLFKEISECSLLECFNASRFVLSCKYEHLNGWVFALQTFHDLDTGHSTFQDLIYQHGIISASNLLDQLDSLLVSSRLINFEPVGLFEAICSFLTHHVIVIDN